MRPHTEHIPKALLPVAGKPFVERQLEWLSKHGVTEVLFLTGYLGEQIEQAVGDGNRWGLKVRYSQEDILLGTGGALRLAADRGLLRPKFLLTYCDSYLRVDFGKIFQKFEKCGSLALMTVIRNDFRCASSNVIFEAGQLSLYDKRAGEANQKRMEFLDYGLLALTATAVTERLEAGKKLDLSDFLHVLSKEGRLVGMEVSEKYYEIGSPEGLNDIEEFFQKRGENLD